MTGFHIGWVDVAVAAILAISILFAFYRGLASEALSVCAWIAAALAAYYLGPYAVPLMAPHFSPVVAAIAGYSLVFVLALLPLLFLAHRISRGVQNSPVAGLDRLLGAGFGIVRGLAAIAVFYIAYSIAVPVPAQANWIKSARTLPLIQTSAGALLNLLPRDTAKFIRDWTERRADNVSAAQDDRTAPAAKSFRVEARRALNRFVEAAGQNGGKKP